jgi:RHS repeat-associated protein
MKKITFVVSNLLFVIILTTIINKQACSQTVLAAEIPVSYDVSASGAFTYSLPLTIPPGIKDMMPDLAITYNSQNGNGNLGLGWSLSGASAITRILPTIYHDKLIAPVDFNSDDALALDGQKLVSTGNGSYKTWIKNFANIQSYGTAGNGPSYFIVENPNGLTYEYGNTTNSKMFAQGKNTVMSWAINKIYDKNGNYILFDYSNDNVNGIYFLTKISYTGNSNLSQAPHTEINFNYTLRPDDNLSWLNGSRIMDELILSDIVVNHNSSMINSYVFGYDNNFRNSRLHTITEKRPNNIELPPLVINWGNDAPSPVDVIYANNNPNSVSEDLLSVGDFNGDGATDYVVGSTWASSGTAYYMHLNDKNNDFGSAIAGSLPSNTYSSSQVHYPGKNMSLNYNGDNYDDMLTANSSLQSNGHSIFKLVLNLSNGSTLNSANDVFTYENVSPNYPAVWTDAVKTVTGDFDGDGKREVIVLVPSSMNVSALYASTYDCFIVGDEFPSGPSSSQSGPYGYCSGDYRYIGSLNHDVVISMAMDYDGDGKDELLVTTTTSYYSSNGGCEIYSLNIDYTASLGNRVPGSPNSAMNLLYGGMYPSANHTFILPGDFNGDGKKDLLTWQSLGNLYNYGTWGIWYSTGEGSNAPSTSFNYRQAPSGLNPYGPIYMGSNGNPQWFGFYVADFDGDGKDDIVQIDASPGSVNSNGLPQYTVLYSSGNNSFSSESGHINFRAGGTNVSVGDFNGDGAADLIYSKNDGGSNTYPLIVYFHNGDRRGLVTSIEHAGKTVEVEYTSFGQLNPYSGNSTNSMPFPFITRQLPIKVVTALHDNFSVNRQYDYSTLVTNLQGLGSQGFEKVFVTDNSSQQITENVFHNTTGEPIAFMSKSTTWDINTYNGIVSNSIPGFPTNTPIFEKQQEMTDWVDQSLHNPTYKITEVNYAKGTTHTAYSIVSSFTSPSQGPASSMFNDFGQADAVIEVDGTVTTRTDYTYDANASFWNKSKPIGSTITRTRGSKPSYTRSNITQYNSQGLLVSQTTDPNTTNAKTVTYSYDSYGNILTSQVSAYGISSTPTSSFAYSTDGRFLTSETNQANYTKTYTYNTWGRRLTETGIDGLTTTFEYDAINRLTKVISPTGAFTSTNYDWSSNSADNPNFQSSQFFTESITNGVSSYAFYDYYNRKIRDAYPAFDGSLIYQDTKYLNSGQIDYSTSPYPKVNANAAITTSFIYDAMGRQTNESSTNGKTLSTSYSLSTSGNSVTGQQVTMTNTSSPILQTKIFTNDASGVNTNIEDNGTTIEFDYGSNGKLLSEKVNGNSTFGTEYAYDAYARCTTKTYPGNNTFFTNLYYYNALNQLTEEKDGANVSTYYTYDILGRTTQKTNPLGNYNYTYNNTGGIPETGKLTLETSPSGTSYAYTYDSYGRLSQLDQVISNVTTFTTNYSYDIYGREVTHQYPSSDVIQKNYNSYGYLESIDLIGGPMPNQRLWQINSKNHLGQITQCDYYGDVTVGNVPLYSSVRGYLNTGYLYTKELTKTGLPAKLVDFDYDFDATTGNLNWRKDLTRNGYKEDFLYDAFDRLTKISEYQNNTLINTQNLKYTDEGNLLKKDDVSNTPYNWKNNGYQIFQVSQPGTSIPAYAIPQAAQSLTYTYSKKVKTIEEGNQKLEFTYWPDEKRAITTLSTLNPPNPPLATKTTCYAANYEERISGGNGGAGSEGFSYVAAEGEVVAILYHKYQQAPGPNRTTTTTIQDNIYYPITDHLGSITHIFDNKGLINNGLVEERSFDAWGRPRDPITWQRYTTNPSWFIDRGYTGHEHLFEFNIINMNGRLYDPLVGRMFNPDPILSDATSSQAYNKYTYVNNNPLKYTDPDGNNPLALIVMGIIGGAVNCYMNRSHIGDLGTGIKYFGVGFVAGVVGGVVGGAAVTGAGVCATSFVGGATVGVAGGAPAGFITGAGNSWIGGANFKQCIGDGMQGAAWGAGTGFVFGGGMGALSAEISGRNWWNGSSKSTYIGNTASATAGDDASVAYSKTYSYDENMARDEVDLIWKQGPSARGRAIEEITMKTDYSDWTRTPYARTIDGISPDGNSVVSIKSTMAPEFNAYGNINKLGASQAQIKIFHLVVPSGHVPANLNSIIKLCEQNEVLFRLSFY